MTGPRDGGDQNPDAELELADRLAVALTHTLKTLTAVRRQVRDENHPEDTALPLPVLFTLAEGPMRIGALADAVWSDVSTISRQVADLVDRGYVEKVTDPQDRRAQRVTLTEAGRELVARVRRTRADHVASLLADWEPERIEQTVVTLEDLRAAFTVGLHGHGQGDGRARHG